jgi:hypothetical protein
LNVWSIDIKPPKSEIEMNVDTVKSRIELSGLIVIKTKFMNDSWAQIIVQGGPIMNVYAEKGLKLQGRNLELMEGVFADDFEMSRVISEYNIERGTRKNFELVVTTDNHFTCRDAIKILRNLNVKIRLSVDS